MKKNWSLKIRRIAQVSLLLSIFVCFSSIKMKAQMVTYSGPIEYYLELNKKAEGKGSDGGYNWKVEIEDKRIIKGSFFVTFTGNTSGVGGMNMYKLTSIEENIEFSHMANNEGSDLKSMGRDMPDSERSRKYGLVASRLSPGKPVITSGFLMFLKGKCRIMLNGEMDVTTTTELWEEETYPQNQPPKSFTETKNIKMPVVISGEANSDNLKYLEGTFDQLNEQSDDCRKCMDGNLASLAHGDMDCSYVSKITTSWTLVKRNKECDATITYMKGDVKINGIRAEKGAIQVGAGDVIETGRKSRISFSLKNGNETYMLGSKSKLQLTDPCKPDVYKPPSKGLSSVRFLVGKLFTHRIPSSYTREDFESDKEWAHFKAMNISWFRYGGAGVRGGILKAPSIYFASLEPAWTYYPLLQEDSEKLDLIPEYSSIPKEADAFYIHCEDGEVKDITAVKGTIKIEDGEHMKSKTIQEGTTINQWDDGTIISDIFISAGM
jgi:hypothetical protein